MSVGKFVVGKCGFGKFVCRKICLSENLLSENVVSENLFVGKFAVGKIVSENLPSEKLLSEKPPRPTVGTNGLSYACKNNIVMDRICSISLRSPDVQEEKKQPVLCVEFLQRSGPYKVYRLPQHISDEKDNSGNNSKHSAPKQKQRGG